MGRKIMYTNARQKQAQTLQVVRVIFPALLCLLLVANRTAAEVPDPGFKSLFIGHSFFRPFAEGMPDYAAAAGIIGHTQSIVFSGGASGAPLALWQNASKRAEIQAALDGGDIELFAMTFHPSYPTTEGYENWIDYALSKNPTTRIALALPWLTQPAQLDAATYASSWQQAHTLFWHDFVDSLRALYPGVDIYSIPYGQSAGELRLLFAANNLPDVQNLTGSAATSIFTDALGHAGNILRDLGRLVWLNAIYDVDLLTYSYGPNYTTDLHSLAQSIMDEHDPDYDAAYHEDVDGDRVGDTIDNCPLIANADQIASALEPGRGIACEGLPPGC